MTAIRFMGNNAARFKADLCFAARDRAGAVLVEFALALPLLLLLLAGGYELGRAMWQHHLVDKGVRDATRFLTRVPNPTDAASVALARQLLMTGTLDAGAPTIVPEWAADPTLVQVAVQLKTFDNSNGDFRGPNGSTANITVVQLTATVKYTGVGLLSFIGLGNGLTYTITQEERHYGE